MYRLVKNMVTPLKECYHDFTEVFMDIIAMHRNGYSIRKIAKIKGIHRKTVKSILKQFFPHIRRKREEVRFLNLLPDYQGLPGTRWLQATWIFERLKRMGMPQLRYPQGLCPHGKRAKKPGWRMPDWDRTGSSGSGWLEWLPIQEANGRQPLFMPLPCFWDIPGHVCRVCSSVYPGSIHGLPYQCFPLLRGVPPRFFTTTWKTCSRRENGGNLQLEFLHFAHHYGFQPGPAPRIALVKAK